MLRTVPLEEFDHEHVVFQLSDVVLGADILWRLERDVGDSQDKRFRWRPGVFSEDDDQPAEFRREVVVKAPESPVLEGESPRRAGQNRFLRVELGENSVGRVDVGSGPEVLVRGIDESDLGSRLDVETLRNKTSVAGIGYCRGVRVDGIRLHHDVDDRCHSGSWRFLLFGARRAGKEGRRHKGKREGILKRSGFSGGNHVCVTPVWSWSYRSNRSRFRQQASSGRSPESACAISGTTPRGSSPPRRSRTSQARCAIRSGAIAVDHHPQQPAPGLRSRRPALETDPRAFEYADRGRTRLHPGPSLVHPGGREKAATK